MHAKQENRYALHKTIYTGKKDTKNLFSVLRTAVETQKKTDTDFLYRFSEKFFKADYLTISAIQSQALRLSSVQTESPFSK